MSIQVKVQYNILRPAQEVFDAIVNPDRLSRYFISESSGPLVTGAQLQWKWADVGAACEVEAGEIVPQQKIAFVWKMGDYRGAVKLQLTTAENGGTDLLITEDAGFEMDEAGIAGALRQTQGWTDFCCCLRAYLYTGVNLRNGKFDENTTNSR